MKYTVECSNHHAHVFVAEGDSMNDALLDTYTKLKDLYPRATISEGIFGMYRVVTDNNFFVYSLSRHNRMGIPEDITVVTIGKMTAYIVAYDMLLQSENGEYYENLQYALDKLQAWDGKFIEQVEEDVFESVHGYDADFESEPDAYMANLKWYAAFARETLERSGITMSDIGCKAVDRELDK